jgi:hypothetical protein
MSWLKKTLGRGNPVELRSSTRAASETIPDEPTTVRLTR